MQFVVNQVIKTTSMEAILLAGVSNVPDDEVLKNYLQVDTLMTKSK